MAKSRKGWITQKRDRPQGNALSAGEEGASAAQTTGRPALRGPQANRHEVFKCQALGVLTHSCFINPSLIEELFFIFGG